MSFVCTGWATHPGTRERVSGASSLVCTDPNSLRDVNIVCGDNFGFQGIQHYPFTKDCLDLKQSKAISDRHQCGCDCDHITRSAILVLPQTHQLVLPKNIRIREKIYTLNLFGFKSFLIESFHFKFRIQNLRRHDRTGQFLFRIRPHVWKQQNQSRTKTFRIRHEYVRSNSL